MTNALASLFLMMSLSFSVAIAQSDDTSVLSVAAVGDIMLGTNFPAAHYLPQDNGKQLLSSLHHDLQSADITFGNLEGVVLNKGGKLKSCKDSTKCYAFRMPEYLLSRLFESGFDLFSTANNHVNDFGEEGRKNTAKVLKERGFYFAGFEDVPYTIFEKNNLKIGFCAFSPNIGTVIMHDKEKVKGIVKLLEDNSDIVIASFHGGAEGSKHQRVLRKTEMFYGENRGNVYEYAHMLIDAGADLVLGHGPHVTRGIELYKDRFITYSMGNFCTYGRFNLQGSNGIAPLFKLKLDAEGKFISGKVIATKQIGRGIAQKDTSGKVIQELKYLSEIDFPESDLEISLTGEIVKKD